MWRDVKLKSKWRGQPKVISCHVKLADENVHAFEIDEHLLGWQLEEMVCRLINLLDGKYFSCCYHTTNDKIWIQREKPVIAQVKDAPMTFSFEVKFYPEHPASLHDDVSRHFVFLQVLKDTTEGRLPCSFRTAAELGSLAAQWLLGNHIGTHTADYLKYVKIAPPSLNDDGELLEEIERLHCTHRGVSKQAAEIRFLDRARKVAMYGVHLYPGKRVGDNMRIMIGVCSSGLIVFHHSVRLLSISWPRIVTLRCLRSHFNVKLRRLPDQRDEWRGTAKLKFKSRTVSAAERLFQLVVDHHMFFRISSPDQRSPPVHGSHDLPLNTVASASVRSANHLSVGETTAHSLSRQQPVYEEVPGEYLELLSTATDTYQRIGSSSDNQDAAADDTYSSLQPVRQELPLGYDSLQLVATVPTDTYQPLVPPRDTRASDVHGEATHIRHNVYENTFSAAGPRDMTSSARKTATSRNAAAQSASGPEYANI